MTVQNLESKPTRSSKHLLADVGWFYLLALLLAGGFGLLQLRTPLNPDILTLNQFGPLCAVVVLMMLGGRALRRRCWPLQSIARRDIVAILAMLGVALLIFGSIMLVYNVFGWDVHFTGLTEIPVGLPILIAAQLLGAAGEEVGWRGFLQHRLQFRFSVTTSGAIVGLMWGMWHPYVFVEGIAFASGFLVWTVAMSLIMAVACEGWQLNRIVCGVSLHCAVNIGLMLMLDDETGSARAMITTSIITAAVAALTVALTHRRRRASSGAMRSQVI